MDRLLQDIRKYWGRRAPSFFDNINQEDPDRWMDVIEQEIPVSENCRVLDIGTGPGFFAVALAKRGYDVTAVDLTPEMLEQAKKNAGPLAEKIHFLPMDAEHLDFPDNSFDVLVTRNLTWNLEHPDQAYAEWFRVMRPGGTLLNFDANWYRYLYQDDHHAAEHIEKANLRVYDDSETMENIARKLCLSKIDRPLFDLALLDKIGFSRVTADKNIWKKVWSEEQKRENRFTPCFMIKACKEA